MADSNTQNLEPIKPADNRRPDGTFGPGNIANPKGRPPRGWTWADLLEEAAEEVLTAKDGQKISAKKAITKRLLMMAVEGDRLAIKDIMDRTDGYPQQNTDVTSSGQKLDFTDALLKAYGKTKKGSPDNVSQGG